MEASTLALAILYYSHAIIACSFVCSRTRHVTVLSGYLQSVGTSLLLVLQTVLTVTVSLNPNRNLT